MTRIMKCNCINTAQDKIYGKGRRVHNSLERDDEWRCTSCAKVNKYSPPRGVKKEEGKKEKKKGKKKEKK